MGNKIRYILEDNVIALKTKEVKQENGTLALQVAVVIKPRANPKVERREYNFRHARKLAEDADGYKLGKCLKSDRFRNYATKEKHLYGLFVFEVEEAPEDSKALDAAIVAAGEEYALPEGKIKDVDVDVPMEERGDWVKKTRLELGMTQAELGDYYGISAKKVSVFERNIIAIDDMSFEYFLKAFNRAQMDKVKAEVEAEKEAEQVADEIVEEIKKEIPELKDEPESEE